MVKILFVCHGNICRSPMGEYVMKDMVKKAGREKEFHIASAAVSREEIGNPVYPPARRELARHGIACGGCLALTRKSAGRSFPGMWRTPGIPGILRPPGTIS